jgi:hypothetical protein
MRLFAIVIAILFTLTASGQTKSVTDVEMAKRDAIFQRARELYPRRRDTPLRYLNINDIEVREIQRLAAGIELRELLNISPVVTGCSCEEGPDCTEQVTIVGRYKDHAVEIQLSRLRNRWSIGRVQRWWLDYAALQAREPLMDRREYEKASRIKVLEFPMCPDGAAPAPATDTATAKAAVPVVTK